MGSMRLADGSSAQGQPGDRPVRSNGKLQLTIKQLASLFSSSRSS